MSFIKFIRIFLLVLIIIGIGLLCTQNIWVPKIVKMILKTENQEQTVLTLTQTPVSTITQVTSPSTGIQWAIGTTHNITWIPPQKVASVLITLNNNVSTSSCSDTDPSCPWNTGFRSYVVTPNPNFNPDTSVSWIGSTPNNGLFSWTIASNELEVANGSSVTVPAGTYQIQITELDSNGKPITGQVILESGWFKITSGATTTYPNPTSCVLAGGTRSAGNDCCAGLVLQPTSYSGTVGICVVPSTSQ